MEQQEDKKNKKQALLITLAIQVVLALLIVFIVAWRAPDPPIPEYGIELNFGTVDAGQGEIQPENTQDVTSNEDTEVEEPATDEATQEVTEESTIDEVQEPVEATQQTSEPEPVETTENTPAVNSNVESPNVVPESKPEKTDKKDLDEVNDVTKPVKPDEKAPVKDNSKSTEKGASATDNSKNSNDSKGNGDKNKPGDQGDKEGEIDQNALYGNQGSNDGSMLEMAGWEWDEEPEPADKSEATGKIVFEITVDQDGYITKIVTIEKSVPPAVVQVYRRAVEELTFSKKSGYKPAASSTGKITFIIKAN
ncbi:MAG: hypothetical protein WBA74_12755 [Cyclobacteriaceae bacterium]